MSAGSLSLWFLNSFRASRLSGLLLSVVLLAFASSGWSFACPPECVLPSCHCPSSSVAGVSGKPPQFVIITVDDALGDIAYDLTEQVIGQGHTNPNGSPLPFTYFVSNNYSNYHKVQQRHAQGHEIAVHTMTHSTSEYTSHDEWRAEIIGSRKHLSELAQIPMDDLVGFRAPYLMYSDESMNVLYDQGFLYDSSIGEWVKDLTVDGGSYIWPYTFDVLGAQACYVGSCPEQPYPGLWEVPIWSMLDGNDAHWANMDPEADYYTMLYFMKLNFDRRYASNRAPLGIYLHAPWFEVESNVNALNDFIRYAAEKQNVWFVTTRQLVEWMKDPVPAEQMATWPWVQYTAPFGGVEVADGWDNDGDGSVDEDTVNYCEYPESWFYTNAACPDSYPSLQIEQTHALNVIVEPINVADIACEEPAWVADRTYLGGQLVSHLGKRYFAKWWPLNIEPNPYVSENQAWRLDGECNSTDPVPGSVTPLGKVRIASGGEQDINFTVSPGFQIEYITVNGVSIPVSESFTLENVFGDHEVRVLFSKATNSVADTPAVITGTLGASTTQSVSVSGRVIASDIDGLTDLSYFELTSPPINGQALINAITGMWAYVPGVGFTGLDPFVITVTDDLGGTTEQVIAIVVTAPDGDSDGIYDTVDNCLEIANADQSDIDNDSMGDLCDIDIDGDSIRNTIEVLHGTDPNDPSDGDMAEVIILASSVELSKNVPAMGGAGLLALGLSMLGLGAVRMKKNSI